MNAAIPWVLLSAAGLVVSGYLVRETILDLEAMGPRANGRRKAALSRLLRESLRISVHVVYLAMGLPLLGRDVEWGPVILGLMWGNVVLVANSLTDAWMRRQTMATRRGEPPLRGGH